VKYSIHPATIQDAEEISRLVNSAYRGESSRAGWTTEADYLDGQRTNTEIIRGEISDPSRKIILCLREKPAGEILSCVLLEKISDDECYLGMLTVKPTLQAKGLGRILLEAAETRAREWGARRMSLTVVHVRDTLMAWYERRGYGRTKETKPFPYGDELFGLPKIEGLFFHVFKKELR
jgi:GNAT superfamily N-acetyltransferase